MLLLALETAEYRWLAWRTTGLGLMGNPWTFQLEDPKLNRILIETARLLHSKSSRQSSSFQEFHNLLSSPTDATNKLGTITAPGVTLSSLDKKQEKMLRFWCQSDMSSIVQIIRPFVLAGLDIGSFTQSAKRQGVSNDVVVKLNYHNWKQRDVLEEELLRSLVRQILVQRPALWDQLHGRIAHVFLRYNIRPRQQHLWKMLHHLLSDLSNMDRLIVLVDGGNQCPEGFISELALLTRSSSLRGILTVVVASTTKPSLPSSVNVHTVELGMSHVRDLAYRDAERRLDCLINQNPVWRESKNALLAQLHTDSSDRISTSIGLNYLEQQQRLTSTRGSVNKFLEAPLPFHEDCFVAVSEKLAQNQQARLAVNWIHHAIRPIRYSELAVALALGAHQPSKMQPNLEWQDLVESVSCDIMRDLPPYVRTLIKTIDEESLILHADLPTSMLENENLFPVDFHATCTQYCLQYLELQATTQALSDDASEGQTANTLATSFLEYAQLYWIEHFKLHIPATEKLDNRALDFLGGGSKAFASWHKRLDESFKWQCDLRAIEPLLLCVHLRLNRLVGKLLIEGSSEESISAYTIERGVAIAARTGNVEAFKHLITRTTNDSVLLSSFHGAAAHGHTHVITSIIDHAHRSNTFERISQSSDISNIIIDATAGGHTDTLTMILSTFEAATLDATDSDGYTAVHLASQLGDHDSLHVLHDLRKDGFASIMDDAENDDSGIVADSESNPGSPSLTPLHLACISGDTETFDFMRPFSTPKLLNQEDEEGQTPLMLASKAGNIEIVERLLDAKVSLYNRTDNAAIECAAESGHVDIVRLLCETMIEFHKNERRAKSGRVRRYSGRQSPESSRGSFSVSDTKGHPLPTSLRLALTKACQKGHLPVVEYLLHKPRRWVDRDKVLLEEAARSGNVKIMRSLVKLGLVIPSSEEEYNTAMDGAIGEDHANFVKFLIERGVGPQWDGSETSVHYAARNNKVLSLRQLILSADEDEIRRKNIYQDTALDVTLREGRAEAAEELLDWEDKHPSEVSTWSGKVLHQALKGPHRLDMMKLLLKRGWDINQIEPDSRDHGLHVVSREANDEENDDLRAVIQILSEANDVDVRNKKEETPLLIACKMGKMALARHLLSWGADPNATDSQSWTTLNLALSKGHEDIANLLLASGSTTAGKPWSLTRETLGTKTPDGKQAIHLARTSHEIMKALLDHSPQPDINAASSNDIGRTVLMDATNDLSLPLVELLVKGGAHLNASDEDGWTALHHAVVGGPEDESEKRDGIVQFLRLHGADVDYSNKVSPSPLYLAIRNERYGLARALLRPIIEDGRVISKAADPNIFGGSFHSPLQVAAFLSNRELVVELLKAGAKRDAVGGAFGSPIHAATCGADAELLRLLLRGLTDEQTEEQDHAASRRGDTATPRDLVSIAAPPFGTPLHSLISRSDPAEKPPLKEMAAILVENGADINARNFHERRPIIVGSVISGSLETGIDDALDLMDLGADPNLVDGFGSTALHQAAAHEVFQKGLVATLLENGARVDIVDGVDRTVLSRAALRSTADEFMLVLAKVAEPLKANHMAGALGASIKSPDKEKRAFGIIMQQEGVNLSEPDRAGWTALDVADSEGLDEQRMRLEKRGACRGNKRRPTTFSKSDVEPVVRVSDDGREAWMEPFDNGQVQVYICGAVRANSCIPPPVEDEDSIFYFEVTVQDLDSEDAVIAIGVVEEFYPLQSHLSWEKSSWCFLSDGGGIVVSTNKVSTVPGFAKGQVVGVAVDRQERTLWFTLDGKRVGDVCEDVSGQLFPAVSFIQGRECDSRATGPQRHSCHDDSDSSSSPSKSDAVRKAPSVAVGSADEETPLLGSVEPDEPDRNGHQLTQTMIITLLVGRFSNSLQPRVDQVT
ncbi:hypothetical protein NM208_g8657 [Fusarium decemcellulare]|uniref:Uncharacterized protein n=1 Tax=Fusarium decemcellulare TaxID=57161 RepID=A0ACC1S4J7_9HYPO|nr:hypothetical protein NM208_g8657 [Fusarium decemcellulare]